MLTEIKYRSQQGFAMEFNQSYSVELSFTNCPAVSTSKIIQLTLSSPQLHSWLCFALLLSPFLLQEILTIADQRVPPLQEAAGTSLPESEWSAPMGVCQQLGNKGYCSPSQRFCYTHGELEVKNLNTVITGAVCLKLADRGECLTNNCCELRWLI